MGDYQARFCESLKVRFFGATRLMNSHFYEILKKQNIIKKKNSNAKTAKNRFFRISSYTQLRC